MNNLTFAQLRQYAQVQGISIAAKLRLAELGSWRKQDPEFEVTVIS